MGVGIFVIVIGVFAGGVLLLAPRATWWITQSWRFADPAAHEPGETGLTLTRIGGVLFLAIAVGVGGVVIVQDLRPDEPPATIQADGYTGPGWPRGSLPVVGYVPEQTPRGVVIDVYYLAPEISVQRSILITDQDRCMSAPTFTPTDDHTLDVSVELVWVGGGNEPESGHCTVDERFAGAYKLERASSPPVARVGDVLTDSRVVTVANAEILPSAPGNRVPELPGPPATDSIPQRGVDRGPLPIGSYEITDDGAGHSYLNISYLSPQDPDAPEGSAQVTGRGCEVSRVHSDPGADVITVNVRLSWSDDNGRYNDSDRERCRNVGPWVAIRTLRWLRVSGNPTVITDGPIANQDGTMVPAAPGNRVPEKHP